MNESNLYFLLLMTGPFLGMLISNLYFKKNFQKASRIAAFGIWIGFFNSLMAWGAGLPFAEKKESWGFVANEISWLMATLILFISAIVHQYSVKYMAGDKKYRVYFLYLCLVTLSSLFQAASNHLLLLIFFWSLSNLLLVLLMMHKWQWAAAKNSGILALKTFGLGLVFLSAGAGLLAYALGTFSISLLLQKSHTLPASTQIIALILITLAALTQSGGWPFHRWLISSLNSPTPVSALMHAGLVNGGGLLLARFAPLFFQESFALDLLFLLAVATLVLGGVWKLLQSDIKRMLACSTMAQMGFMLMQCSLGLFPAALAHLCWHGLFKAFLFLKSGSSLAEQGRANERISTLGAFLLSSLCGVMGARGFIFGSGLSFSIANTTAVLVFFCWIASTQLAYSLLKKNSTPTFVLAASFLCLAMGSLYGLTVGLIEAIVAPLHISQPHPLNALHMTAILIIFCMWIALNVKPFTAFEGSRWWRYVYMRLLNTSQPDPKTLTLDRNEYKF